MKEIGILGLWHLGCVYSASFANKGLNVIGFDVDKDIISSLKKGKTPISEPGLDDLINRNLDNNLHFTSDPKSAVENKDYIFITLDTPVDNHDRVQMKSFYKLFDLVKKYILANTVLVISSQVPVGTCKDLQDRLKKFGKNNLVIYFPENLRLGIAIQTFLKPERIVIGANNQEVINKFLKDFNFFDCPVLKMSLESAEMVKHSLNSYLAIMISFCSEISDFCEFTGANSQDVMKALKTDTRVSPNAPLSPGIGFAGGTLGRDLQTLKMVAKKWKYTPKLIKAVYDVNQDRLPLLIEKINGKLGQLKGKKIGLLGLTYKPGTNTLRRSQSLDLAMLLSKSGAHIAAIDPAIDYSPKIGGLKVVISYNDFFSKLDAIVLMTGWEEFKNLDPREFSNSVRRRIIFDSRNFLDKGLYEKAGFLYVGIGFGEQNLKV